MSKLQLHAITLENVIKLQLITITILITPSVWQVLDPNYLRTLKAGGRERERERLALANESLIISKNIMCASAFA